MNPLIQLKQETSLFLVALVLGCFAAPTSASAQALPRATRPPGSGQPRPGATRPPSSAPARPEATRPPSARGEMRSPSEIQRQPPSEAGSPTQRAAEPQRLGTEPAAHPGDNTAAGKDALLSLTSGAGNTGVGFASLRNNTTGNSNTAVGYRALENNSASGSSYNTAVGAEALFNSIGTTNTAFGCQAMYNDKDGQSNTAVGYQALYDNKGGTQNVAIGQYAGARITSSLNVCIGAYVGGKAGESKTTRIANIYRSAVSARAVYVDSDNKLGTLASSRRVKENIKPMDKVSEAIFALTPVTFRYKKEIDGTGTLQFGLIAEEVAEINSDLVTRDDEGKPETVRYESINAMLLNEFLKEHRKNEEQRATIEQLRKEVETLVARVEEHDSKIQRVTDQAEMNKAAPQLVASDR